MKYMRSATLRALFVAAVTSCLAFGQNAQIQAAGAKASADLEPRVLNALKAMSDQLRATNSYSFTVHLMEEEPATNGQMLEFFKVIHVDVKRPDKLRLTETSDGAETGLWYDGKNVTVMPSSQHIYAVLPAAPTLNATLPILGDRLETNQFIRTLLSADPYATLTDGLSSANEVGFVEVGGKKLLQTAFTEPDANWQLWLTGPAPVLPSRLAVVYKTAEGAPRVELEFSEWNLNPQTPDRNFAFTKPAGAVQVDFKNLEPRSPVQK
jgi:hypothetical protein